MTSDRTEGTEALNMDALLDAALMHVAFDGWTEATFAAAVADTGIDPTLARALCPRGAVDLALAYHRRGDQVMLQRLATEDLTGLRFRDKIAAAVRFRLEAVEDKEAVRRGVTLFALPSHAADGAKAIWGTVDAIWTALGDTSEDINWYSKRATLSGVYSSTVLFWLGDETPGHQATWEFLDRRIDNVMQFEKLKADVQKNPLLKPLLAGPAWLAGQIRKPREAEHMPGRQGRR
ncbi:COQ9 family protein [Phaeobacter sp. QD34_3]|uniref:COQ9 family protein n=1 Tax=unclassified Phaeobacter TaxID=2621772 RepID=UPI00237FCB82|nr:MULTISPECIES: COQ9 family protein [unclassified Phaeobacter]MDE4132596.1 COQ9 family protein [Phaeobacter sp. QD34_3]MDE4136232.1 COQ9 family protein [Phaeobacter sp. QD34_24]